MGVVKIKKVKTTILALKEGRGGEKTIVSVTLLKGESVKGTDYFSGIMSYRDKKKDKFVDMVTAYFSHKGGAGGDEGNVQLRIDLDGTNRFIPPFVTTVPDDETKTPLHCINAEPTEKPSSLMVKFLEPKRGESIAYPTLYFHTSHGVIDPGINVQRHPPK